MQKPVGVYPTVLFTPRPQSLQVARLALLFYGLEANNIFIPVST